MPGTRSALIVATYQHDDPGLTRLQAPARDAEVLAEILSDADIGGYDVSTVVNGRSHEVTLAVGEFFHDRRPDDLLLLHFSCHGLKDDSGELYFAATDTRLDLLEATGVASSYVSKAMDRTRAGRVLLLLDCCYAGAFARAGAHRSAGSVDVADRLGGRGRVVITASSALQYSFEGQELASGEASPSVFTSALVRGLRTGEADRDQDGWVSLDELYAYVYDEVTAINPNQTPKKWAFDIEGDVFVARRGGPVVVPSELPTPVTDSMTSLVTWEREAVVQPLRELLQGPHPGRALGARLALEHLAADDDSARVRAAAQAALAGVPEEPARSPQPEPRSERPPERPPEPAGSADVATVARDVDDTIPTTVADPADTSSAGSPADARQHRRWLIIGAAVVVVCGLVAWAWQGLAGSEGTAQAAALKKSEMVVGATTGLLVYDESTAGSHRTIPGIRGARMPSISPDRQWIAYLPLDATSAARLVRADGSENHALLTGANQQQCPFTTRVSWSPDSTRLAFACDSDSEYLGLYVYTLGTKTLLKLHGPKFGDGGTLRSPPTWRGNSEVISPVFGSEGAQLWTIPLDASSAASQAVSPESGAKDTSPTWSNSGLLFLREQPNGTTTIELQSSTGPPRTLVRSGSSGRQLGAPAWSPDGSQVAWELSDHQTTQLRRAPLTAQGLLTASPDWEPTVPGEGDTLAWDRR